MKIKSKHLDEAVSEEIISKEQSVALRAFLESRAARLRALLPMPLRKLAESRDYGGKLNTRKVETL